MKIIGFTGRAGKFLLAFTVLLVLLGCQSGTVEQDKSALEMVSSPWNGYGVGSFVHYKILMTAGNFEEEKQTVLEIRRNQVVLQVSRLGNNDEWEHKNMIIMPLKVMGRPEKTIKVTEDTITIKGKLLKCKVEKQVGYDTEHNNKKIVIKTWMSDDVPGVVVRISHNDAIAVEVVDFEKK
ncbi:MAG: hypothetical protein V1871_00715 [Planctomycetota bacterium]